MEKREGGEEKAGGDDGAEGDEKDEHVERVDEEIPKAEVSDEEEPEPLPEPVDEGPGWLLTTFKLPEGMEEIPSLKRISRKKYKIGSAKVDSINADGDEFSSLVAGTPHDHFVWRYDGIVTIEKDGEYEFCTSSDDGSWIAVNGERVENDDGLHGVLERCGKISLTSGDFPVVVLGFEKDGHAHMDAKYSGPDTGGKKILLPSTRYPGKRLEWPKKGWSMTTYKVYDDIDKTPKNFEKLRENGMLLGKTRTQFIHDNADDFMFDVPKTPEDGFAFQYKGMVEIQKGGKYKFCTSSDDGSVLLVDGDKVVDNDGLHGVHEECGKVELKAGEHMVKARGFERGGHAFMAATYSGPDTGGKKMMIRAIRGSEKRPKDKENEDGENEDDGEGNED